MDSITDLEKSWKQQKTVWILYSVDNLILMLLFVFTCPMPSSSHLDACSYALVSHASPYSGDVYNDVVFSLSYQKTLHITNGPRNGFLVVCLNWSQQADERLAMSGVVLTTCLIEMINDSTASSLSIFIIII